MARAGLTSAATALWERLNPRERVLLGLMAVVAVGMSCFLIVLLTNRSLTTLKAEVNEQATLLKELQSSADQIRERLDEQRDAFKRVEVEPPPLGTQLQDHATKAGMGETDLEMTPQPEEQVGGWVRTSVEVRLRRKPLGQLAEFWALTVNDRAQYPVAITKLNIRRRLHEDDAYDVEMTVSSYRPSKEPAATKNGGRSGAGRGKNKSGSESEN